MYVVELQFDHEPLLAITKHQSPLYCAAKKMGLKSLNRPKRYQTSKKWPMRLHRDKATAMETLFRVSLRLLPVSAAVTCRSIRFPVSRPDSSHFLNRKLFNLSSSSSSFSTKAGWLLGLGDKKKKMELPEIVLAGDPVLHEKAREVDPEEIGSERIQKIIDDMIKVMRLAPGVGLAAPQIGVPLRIIVLEDTKEYISYAPKDEILAQERRPFDLMVMVNPKLKESSNKKALFFEGCLSVNGFRAAVERYLEVVVTGYDRQGKQIEVNASGWQARILQHECDHLDGNLYVDKMVPRTFRTVDNLDLPLAEGCPKLGPQ